MSNGHSSAWFVCAAMLCIAAGTAMGQIAGSGTIQGTITDPTGAVIPHATVVATNTGTGVTTNRVTTAAGLYVLSPLQPAVYNVQVSAPGFQTQTQERITVDALSTISLDVRLAVGSAAEQITVEASASALRTEDVSLGHTMQNNVYNALPLAMTSGVPRDPTQFIRCPPAWRRWSLSRPDRPTPRLMARSRKPTACIWKAWP